jgi:hypothetical protein
MAEEDFVPSPEQILESFFHLRSRSPSVVPTDETLEAAARAKLDAYEPRNGNDRTAIVLRAFLNELPAEGLQNLLPFIASCSGGFYLHALSEHLQALILSCK